MPAYEPEPETDGARRHQIMFAAGVMTVALAMSYLSDGAQEGIAASLRASVLRPFLATEERLAAASRRGGEIESLRAQLDTLVAVVSTQSALVDENRTLRELLGLAERAGPGYLPATVLRSGTRGSEFRVERGSEDGVQIGAPVVGAHGLVGRLSEVYPGSSIGMDWSHPDFKVSAMLADGTTYGIVENVRGTFREEDRLMLTGLAYDPLVPDGTLVVTSGLGGLFPRGIPVGRIEGTVELEPDREVQGSWQRSYWLRPMVEPGSATYVLIVTTGGAADVSEAWPADPVIAHEESVARGPGS